MSERPPVPFHRPSIDEAEIAAVVEVLRSGWLTTGPKTREFEDAFAARVGARHAIAVTSGTAALHLALLAAGVGPGDAILTTPLTFPATTEVALYCGAQPRFADVDPKTLNLDPGRVEEVLRREGSARRFRAIVPVHYAGQACAMEELLPLARRFGLVVVEDAAHAFPAWRRMPGKGSPSDPAPAHLPPAGAEERWRAVGSIGEFTAFSFYATKTITTAEGGMLTCDSGEAADVVRSLRLHGLSGDAWKRYRAEGSWRYDVVRTGYKYNLPDVLSALGLVQLGRAAELATERRRLAALYDEVLAPLDDHLERPFRDPRAGHAWHLYAVRFRDATRRDATIEALRARGIGASVHFLPVHLHTFYRDGWGYGEGDFPVAEAAAGSLLSLPLWPGMGDEGIARVADALGEILGDAA